MAVSGGGDPRRPADLRARNASRGEPTRGNASVSPPWGQPDVGWRAALMHPYGLEAHDLGPKRRGWKRVVMGITVVVLAAILLFSVGRLLKAARPQPQQVYPISRLSPQLGDYLKGEGSAVGVSIDDLTRNRVYGYDENTQFLMGSSAKIPILLEYFHAVETGRISPGDDDQALLTTMIENSNNDAALYFYDEFDDGAGVKQYLASVGITDYTPSDGGFGWGTIAPRDMVRLLTAFYQGRLTNATDRTFALNLMENVEADQQEGVGDTAPSGATVALKDGWVQGPDGAWAANSSGIITIHGKTYIISVYTQEIDSLDDAFSILDTVCAQATRALTS